MEKRKEKIKQTKQQKKNQGRWYRFDTMLESTFFLVKMQRFQRETKHCAKTETRPEDSAA